LLAEDIHRARMRLAQLRDQLFDVRLYWFIQDLLQNSDESLTTVAKDGSM
jgi:hypothetical protein